MKSIFEHTQKNILVIPQALFSMKDVTVLKQHRNSMIFYKRLEQDLVDIEFYTNTPCFIYIETGFEILTNSDNHTIELHPGSAIFLPQGLNLNSDFVKKTDSLTAYLVFFSEQVITSFLTNAKNARTGNESSKHYCLLQDEDDVFISFFNTFKSAIEDPGYLLTKLQELLHLIAWKDHENEFFSLLLSMHSISPKRNLVRLLESHDLLHLSVSDLAHISGRSLSSFNRDFKEIYKTPPKKWLQEKRLTRARELLDQEALSVTEAALEVGYENISNFIKAFKLRYGQTPKQIQLGK